MPVYKVIRKSDGEHVSGYAAAALALLDQYPLAEYDHIEHMDEPPPQDVLPPMMRKH